MPDEIDEFSIQSWNVPMSILDLQCLRAGSSTQPVRRHGSFLARSVVSWFEVWWGVPVPQNEGGLAPRFPKWGCWIDWFMSGHDHGVNFEQRLQFWKWCVGEWEANEADPWAQAWCGQISLCSWSAWPPRWERIAAFAENAVAVVHATWYEGMDQCLRGFHCELSSDGSQLPQQEEAASRYIVDMQVHPQFWNLDRKSLPDSLRRLRIWCSVLRFACSRSRSSPAVVWTQATWIGSCLSSTSAGSIASTARHLGCIPPVSICGLISAKIVSACYYHLRRIRQRLVSALFSISLRYFPQLFYHFVDYFCLMYISFKLD